MTEKPLYQLQPLKELHSDLRGEAARETLRARRRLREASSRLQESRAVDVKLSAEESDLREQRSQLQLEYDSFASRSLLKKLASRLKGADNSSAELQVRIAELGSDISTKVTHRGIATSHLEADETEVQNTPKPQGVLQFYKERLTTEQLTNTEKRELLTPDFLASLSTEQYIELWRKLTPFFVSHITRHGVRQNTGSFHSGGVGYYSTGAKGMLMDGKLRGRHAINGLQAGDPEAMSRYLEQEGVLHFKDSATALEAFEGQLNHQVAAAEAYPDESSVHFAAGKILDQMYGGEQDNQVFAIFPADVIASQYDFSFNDGHKTTFDAHERDEWNDLFVYPNSTKDPGVDLNSGIVFLPKRILVDKDTGSQYQVAERDYDYGFKVENGVMPVIDSELVSRFNDYLHQLSAVEKGGAEKSKRNYEAEFLSGLQALGMKQRFADSLSKEAYRFLNSNSEIDTNDFDSKIKNILYAYPYFWRKAEDAISAEEYWENYFAESPSRRPKHIIYYDGDPNTAVEQFLVENGITSLESPDVNEPYLGYQDHNVADTKDDKRAYPGYDEIIETARAVIDKHYNKNREEQAA